MVRVADDVINDQIEVVRCDSRRDGRSARLDGLDSRGGCAVLEDDTEAGERLMESEEGGQELFLGGEDGDGCVCGGGELAVQVEDHVVLFHGGEDGVEDAVIYDSGRGVRGHTRGV